MGKVIVVGDRRSALKNWKAIITNIADQFASKGMMFSHDRIRHTFLKGKSIYEPHQGKQEILRRQRQIERGIIQCSAL